MHVIEAPNEYTDAAKPLIFLAGSIEMGAAEDWQARIIAALGDAPGTILNPRRRDWDSSWGQLVTDARFVEQVEWELRAQEVTNRVLCYFSPGTKSPIALLELGLFRRKMVVCCPDGFWKKGNVDVVTRWYGIPQVSTLEELAEAGKSRAWRSARRGA